MRISSGPGPEWTCDDGKVLPSPKPVSTPGKVMEGARLQTVFDQGQTYYCSLYSTSDLELINNVIVTFGLTHNIALPIQQPSPGV